MSAPRMMLFPNFRATNKSDALRQIAAAMLHPLNLSRDLVEQVANSLMKREQIGSTGIGRGWAVPHTKCAHTDEFIVACFLCAEPVEFDSLDEIPVRVIFSLISPPDRPGDHLRFL